MAYLDNYARQVSRINNSFLGQVDDGSLNAALLFPLWEQQSPQYQQPATYPLIDQGYRKNELAYRCINKWASAISEAPLHVFEQTPGTDTRLDNHALRALLAQPNSMMGEPEFWRATEIFLKCAGFAAWEMEMSRGGDVLGLHALRPDWCSFLRGERNPLAYVRYQPYGLDAFYIPRERVLLFQYFDPVFPLLKALAPSGIASRVLATDNAATDFLTLFFKRGAVVNGLLTTEQALNDDTAQWVKDKWREQHGGVENWSEIAVLGNGVTYQQMQMDFRQMTFDAIDGRSEARICQAFDMEPILVGAKVGLDRATYSNYEQAKRAWYDGSARGEWTFLAGTVSRQLLPYFESRRPKRYSGFALDGVVALQEDTDAKHTRAREDARLNLITRDEAREMMGLNPIDNTPVFVGASVRVLDQAPSADAIAGDQPEDATLTRSSTSSDGPPDTGDGADNPTDAAKALERKQFKAWLTRGQTIGKPFRFRYLSPDEQAQLVSSA